MRMTFNIFGSLNTAKLGMFAQQAGLSVTGQNVANVNTEGYSRRRVILSSVGEPPTGGGGVEVDGIRRYTDEFATNRLIKEETLRGDAEQRSVILSHVSEMFNDLSDTALGAAMDNYFGALRMLESSPSDPTVRQEVLARGEELADTFNRIASELQGAQVNMDNLLRASAEEVNVRTTRLAEINRQIMLSNISDGDISDLLDERDQLVREVAKNLNVHGVVNDQNQLTLFVEGGLPLVEGQNLSTLRVLASGTPGSSRVEYVASNGQVSDITSRIEGGAMGGTLRVRDVQVPAYIASFDQLAYDMVTAINARHQLGFGLDGVGGRDFFTPIAAPVGAAGIMSVNAAIANNGDAIAAATDPLLLPGDNRNALALAALADADAASGGTMTFNEAYSTLVGTVGVAARRATDEGTLRDTSIKHIEDIRDESGGVSLDEEMTNLIQFQRAYQASARVLNVVDQLIQTILGLGS
ncbi:MAG: flagellar hook-associated protein FlgK [Myxococcota bacterium]|jgi:flagellar hook-associated protein 1 FlgK|nr:flagellar hook-associated protein FlgK [Myxococcota bacterium]